MRYSSILGCLTLLMALGIGCNPKEIEDPILFSTTTPDDFKEEQEVAVDLKDDFTLKLWAPGPLLSNAVAISFDENGIAYVSETQRRKSSDIDIRAHRDWMIGDLSLQSLEDTRQFHLEKLSTDKSDQNTWQEDFNQDGLHDYRDLEVQSEYIRKIWDGDQDGRADSSNLFAEDINSMLTGVGAGILFHNDEVFYTAAPDVYRMKDTNGDGRVDERSIIATGFGIHIAYAGHDMSGLTIGPDGKIYWAIGDLGVNATDQRGKKWVYPNQGVVARANPDGSDFEIFAHGLRNTQELAFDDYGNLISVDNDGDHPGEHERFVHIIEGMDAGWRINWQFGKYNEPNESYKVWTDEKLHIPHFPGQAAYIVPPLALAPDGPAGFAYNPGTALGEQWNGYFFGSYFKGSSARSQIHAFKLKPKGATFELADSTNILMGIASTGIAFGPDGALYINDWKDSYSKKPAGRIWKVDVKQKDARRTQTQSILKEGMGEKELSGLIDFLSYPDQRIRLAAQFELVKRDSWSTLVDIAKGADKELARIHAIWGAGQLAKKFPDKVENLIPLLKDTNAQVRAQTAKVLGNTKYEKALDPLNDLLSDPEAVVRFFAVEALGKLGDAKPFDKMVSMFAEAEDKDPAMRHALAYALSKMPVEDRIADLKQHASEFVRIGAVVTLRHMKSPKVAVFLNDQSPLVVTEAARAIHDDFSIPEALPNLAQAITNVQIKEEAFLRRAINANLRVGGQASAERLIIFSNNLRVDEEMRKDALWALGYWTNPPVLDRVEGRYRPIDPHHKDQLFAAISNDISTLLWSGSNSIRSAAATLIGRIGYFPKLDDLNTILRDSKESIELRSVSLEAIARLESNHAALDFAFSSSNQMLIATALKIMNSLDLSGTKKVALLSKVLDNGAISEKKIAIDNLAELKEKNAEELLQSLGDQLLKGDLEKELKLEVLEALGKSQSLELRNQYQAYYGRIDSTDKIALYQEMLFGGNLRQGLRTFYRNNSAQCIRCHQINGLGGQVGPDLTNIALVLSPEQLLESLVAPNVRIAPGYGTVILEMKNGESVSGVLLQETDNALELKVGEEVKTINIDQIKNKEYLASGMPSMEGVLSKREIRNLMAFLMTLKGEQVSLNQLF